MAGSVVLVSNGPGELYTWVRPVLKALEEAAPQRRSVISLIPCQFASGGESAVAQTFGASGVTTPSQYLGVAAGGRIPEELAGETLAVLSLGGNVGMAVRLARRLSAPVYRYSFVPYWHPRLERLFVHNESAYRKARLLGAPASKLEVVGNLVADAVAAAPPLDDRGDPHVLLMAGSRDSFAVHLIPFMIAVADELAQRFPTARFVWPVPRMLAEETIEAGVRGDDRETFGGVPGRREDERIVGPRGGVIELVPEESRYAHMSSADIAVTIPGTNTLELGIAGVPSVVMLPLNRPEVIPLEGPGHWLSLLPLVGTPLKRRAVKLFVERLSYPVSLPNQLSGEELMVEVRGKVYPEAVAERAGELLTDDADRNARRQRLLETMPGPGAAARIVSRVLEHVPAGG